MVSCDNEVVDHQFCSVLVSLNRKWKNKLFWKQSTEGEPRYHEVLRDWQNAFVITGSSPFILLLLG